MDQKINTAVLDGSCVLEVIKNQLKKYNAESKFCIEEMYNYDQFDPKNAGKDYDFRNRYHELYEKKMRTY